MIEVSVFKVAPEIMVRQKRSHKFLTLSNKISPVAILFYTLILPIFIQGHDITNDVIMMSLCLNVSAAIVINDLL